jgi:hypothetical protein
MNIAKKSLERAIKVVEDRMGEGDREDKALLGAAIVAFLRSAADTHAGCFSAMGPREAMQSLANEVEREISL